MAQEQDHTQAHTPGPWEYNDPKRFKQGFGKFSETAVYAPGNAFHWRMAEIQGPDEATEIANARLIAAAPTQHDALCAAPTPPEDFCTLAPVAMLDWGIAYRKWFFEQRVAAIAKATGAKL